MDWSVLPILFAAAIGLIGSCLMIPALVMISWRGGWRQFMETDRQNKKWTLPRRLLLVGASLGVLFGILLTVLALIPGGIPWR